MNTCYRLLMNIRHMNRQIRFLMNIFHRLSGRITLIGRTMFIGFALLLGTGGIASAAVVSDVRGTNHNLSAHLKIIKYLD